ncbi:MAG: beta-lactamase family protein, partial [Candidatus Latescibacteria bacterium]|nr:beta-lactamase family protein [Candidatus Latescibacterota bacterium]
METMLSLALAIFMNHSPEPLQAPSMEPVRTMMQRAVEDGVFPGGVLLIRYRGEVIFREAFGLASLIPERTPMTVGTLFDIASLTKVVATTTAAMLLREQGKISLDDRLVDWIPEWGGDGKERIAIKHLLTHSSGLVSVVRPKELVPNPDSLNPVEARQRVLEEVYRSPLAYPTGTETRYSDPGFILMEEIVERASGERFDQFCRRAIFLPLDMCETRFNPMVE